MDGMESLRHAIATVPIPGAPPRLSHNGAAVGLALMDTALRLNHVRRLTERLTVVEHGAARRTTEVDISLKLLDEGQRRAATGLRELIGKEHGERSPAATPRTPTTLWVPIARLPRASVAPVDVHDGAGDKLPWLTQHETSRLMASGLYRLLRGILASHEHAHSARHDLNAFLFRLHEPRWLVQRALVTLLTERSHPVKPFALPSSESTVPGYGKQIRDLALKVLDEHAHLLDEYAQLLDIAVRDYLLVVALDTTVDEYRLSYETPLHVDDNAPPTRLADQLRRIRASHSGYFVRYRTTIPANIRSYHLVVQTSPEAEMTRMYLSTDADRYLAESLAANLKSLADRRGSAPHDTIDPATYKILELEAQTATRTLADLLRRRKWEAGRSKVDLSQRTSPACHELAAAATAGEAVRTASNELDNSILRHPSVGVHTLRAAAAELTDRQLGHDLVLVDQVTDNRAQAYWRRSGTSDVYGDQVHVDVGLVLKDSTEAGPRNVMLYAIAVAAICYLLGWLLVGSPWPFGRRATEALNRVEDGQSVITMLLLVPGFLYTRLALPPRRSVAAYLRTVPRVLGELCIVSSAGFAAAIATRSRGEIVQAFFIVSVLVPVLTAALLVSLRSWQEATMPLTRMGVPRWVGGNHRRDPLVENVRFDSTGGQ